MTLKKEVKNFRRFRIIKAVEENKGNIKNAAKAMGISRTILYRWIKVLDLKQFIGETREKHKNRHGHLGRDLNKFQF